MGNLSKPGIFHRYALIVIVFLFLGTINATARTLHGKVVNARTQEPFWGTIIVHFDFT